MNWLHRALALVSILAAARSVAAHELWTPDQPCPSHIRAVIPGSSPFASIYTVHSALKTCPNLSSLQLRIDSFGCSEHPDGYSVPLTAYHDEKYLPSLEVLALEGYGFDNRERQGVHRRYGDSLLPNLTVVNFKGDWWVSELRWEIEVWLRDWYWRLTNWREWRDAPKLSDEDKHQTNLELLLKSMDFSKIHTLAIKGSYWETHHDPTLVRLAEAVPSIRNLTIWGNLVCPNWMSDDKECVEQNPGSQATDFITALPSTSLSSLTWLNGNTFNNTVLDAVLERHGPSLQYLQWRNDELEWTPRALLTTDALEAIGSKAPGLTSLIIDLHQNGTWPKAELEAIAGMENLTNLTLYFTLASSKGAISDSGGRVVKFDGTIDWYWSRDEHIDWELFYAQPRLTVPAATEMFNILQASKKGKDFTTVQFRAGDWTRSYSGALRFGDQWLENKRVWFRCSTLRDDGTPKADGEAACDERSLMTKGMSAMYTSAEWADWQTGALVGSKQAQERYWEDDDWVDEWR